jgi:hypothetical protein
MNLDINYNNHKTVTYDHRLRRIGPSQQSKAIPASDVQTIKDIPKI